MSDDDEYEGADAGAEGGEGGDEALEAQRALVAQSLEVSKLKQHIEVLKRANERIRDQYKQEVRSLLQPLIEKHRKLQAENAKLSEKLERYAVAPPGTDEAVVEELRKLRHDHAVLQKISEGLEADSRLARRLQAELDEAHAQIETLEGKTAELEREKRRLEAMIAERDQIRVDLEEKLDQAQTQATEWREKYDKAVRDHKEELKEYQMQLGEAVAKLHSLEKQTKEVDLAPEVASMLFEELQAELSTYDEIASVLSSTVSEPLPESLAGSLDFESEFAGSGVALLEAEGDLALTDAAAPFGDPTDGNGHAGYGDDLPLDEDLALDSEVALDESAAVTDAQTWTGDAAASIAVDDSQGWTDVPAVGDDWMQGAADSAAELPVETAPGEAAYAAGTGWDVPADDPALAQELGWDTPEAQAGEPGWPGDAAAEPLAAEAAAPAWIGDNAVSFGEAEPALQDVGTDWDQQAAQGDAAWAQQALPNEGVAWGQQATTDDSVAWEPPPATDDRAAWAQQVQPDESGAWAPPAQDDLAVGTEEHAEWPMAGTDVAAPLSDIEVSWGDAPEAAQAEQPQETAWEQGADAWPQAAEAADDGGDFASQLSASLQGLGEAEPDDVEVVWGAEEPEATGGVEFAPGALPETAEVAGEAEAVVDDDSWAAAMAADQQANQPAPRRFDDDDDAQIERLAYGVPDEDDAPAFRMEPPRLDPPHT